MKASNFILALFALGMLTTQVACKGEGGGGEVVNSGQQNPPTSTLEFLNIRPSATKDIAVNTTFELTFSMNLKTPNVSNSGVGVDTVTLTYMNPMGQEMTPINVSVSGNQLIVNPVNDLHADSQYELIVTTALQSTDNVNLNKQYVRKFQTSKDGGTNPGDLVTLSFSDSANAKYNAENPSTYIDKFVVSYGRVSRKNSDFEGYEVNDLELDETPKLTKNFTGSRDFMASFMASFNRGVNYYFTLRTCTVNDVCSDYSNETKRKF